MAALQSSPADMDRFINCLHKLQLHYPEGCRRFLNHVRGELVVHLPRPSLGKTNHVAEARPAACHVQVLFQLPRFQGDFRTMALETVLSQIDIDFAKETAVQAAQELFISLQSKDLAGMLRHR